MPVSSSVRPPISASRSVPASRNSPTTSTPRCCPARHRWRSAAAKGGKLAISRRNISSRLGTIVLFRPLIPATRNGYQPGWNEHGQEVDAAERPLSRDAQGYLFRREQDSQN